MRSHKRLDRQVNVRVTEEMWDALEQIALERGARVADVVRSILSDLVEKQGAKARGEQVVAVRSILD